MDANDNEDKTLYGADLPHASLNGVNEVTPDETARRPNEKTTRGGDERAFAA